MRQQKWKPAARSGEAIEPFCGFSKKVRSPVTHQCFSSFFQVLHEKPSRTHQSPSLHLFSIKSYTCPSPFGLFWGYPPFGFKGLTLWGLKLFLAPGGRSFDVETFFPKKKLQGRQKTPQEIFIRSFFKNLKKTSLSHGIYGGCSEPFLRTELRPSPVYLPVCPEVAP